MKINDQIEFNDSPRLINKQRDIPQAWKYSLFIQEVFDTPHKIMICDLKSGNVLYKTTVDRWSQSNIDNGIHHFFRNSTSIKNITVKILREENVVFEKNQCTDATILTKPIVLIERPLGYAGMGDYFFALPTIKKLSKAFNEKIDVITRRSEMFINNPYVDNVYTLTESIEFAYENFNLRYRQNFFELFPNHETSFLNPHAKILRNVFIADLRQTIAMDCGFHLTSEELNSEFYPNPFMPIDLPEKYVAINPYISGVDRDFGKNNWQLIVDNLNSQGIPVVAIGLPGKYHEINIKLGLNLCGEDCQSNLSQTWHIINNSQAFITFDTGIYVLAGTTDTHIFLVDTYLEPEYHTPYRKGSNKYKLTVINGGCQEHCLGNLRHYTIVNGEFFQPKVQQCALYYDSFKCIPSGDSVSKEVIDYWRSL